MTEPFRILVVCIGNVCRSPLAERHLRDRLDRAVGPAAGSIEVSSAGVRALVGRAMDPQAAHELERLGGSANGFVARQLTRAMMREADLVLTATRPLRSRVLQEEPLALKRTFTLREFAALSGVLPAVASPAALVTEAASHRWAARLQDYDVPDPVGASQQRHREAAELIGDAAAVIATTWSRMPLAAAS